MDDDLPQIPQCPNQCQLQKDWWLVEQLPEASLIWSNANEPLLENDPSLNSQPLHGHGLLQTGQPFGNWTDYTLYYAVYLDSRKVLI